MQNISDLHENAAAFSTGEEAYLTLSISFITILSSMNKVFFKQQIKQILRSFFGASIFQTYSTKPCLLVFFL